MQILGLNKFLIAASIIMLFGAAILGIVESGMFCGASGLKDCNGLIRNVGDVVLGPSQRITESVEQMKSSPPVFAGLRAQAGNATDSVQLVNRLEAGYTDFLRQQIISSFLMVILVIFLSYKMIATVAKSAEWELGTKLVAILAVVVVLALVQMMYGYFALSEFVWPYKGLLDLAWNWGVVFG